MGMKTLTSAYYILSDESSIPFYSTRNGYKYHQLDSSFSVSFDDHQTLTADALSPDSIKIPALRDVHSLQSKQQRHQLELSLSVSRDIRHTLTDAALSSYSITLVALSALDRDVHASQSKHQLEFSLSVSHDFRQTLFGEALSNFIKIPALSALFGVLRSSQSNQQQNQLELSLSDLRYVCLMLTKTQHLELSKFALSDTRNHNIIALSAHSSLKLRFRLDFSSTALCGSSRWLHQQQYCPSLLNLNRYALLTATVPSLLRTSCSLLKVFSKLQECIVPSLHDKIRIKIT